LFLSELRQIFMSFNKGRSRNYPQGRSGRQRFFLSGGWMHNNVKFVLTRIFKCGGGSWYSDLSRGWAFVLFRMSWGWRSQKKLPPTLPWI